ncbi:MAG: hypothetical protein CMI26_02865 [Opitutae bacterium]|nr:hypothetical protein [Opitutae bacterium]
MLQEVPQSLRSKKNWSDNTIQSLLTSLVKKEVLKETANTSGVRIFFIRSRVRNAFESKVSPS